MDIPGTAYARAAAEITLNLVHPTPICRAAVNKVVSVDLAKAIRGGATSPTSISQQQSPSPQSSPSGSPGSQLYSSPGTACMSGSPPKPLR